MQTEQKSISDPEKAETGTAASAENSMCRTADLTEVTEAEAAI